MKTIITLAALSLAATTASAQSEKPDTLLNATELGRVIIIDGADGLTVRAMAAGDSTATFDYHQNYSNNVSVSSHRRESRAIGTIVPEVSLNSSDDPKWGRYFLCHRFTIGFNASTASVPGLDISPWSSADISWLGALAFEARQLKGRNIFTTGLGFSWRNFRTISEQQFKITDGKLSVGSFPEGTTPDWSRVKVFSLSVPLFWEHRFSKSHLLTLGPIVNFNTHSSIRSRYQDGNHDVHASQYFGQHAPVTVDLFASLTIYGSIGVYARYSPMNILKTGHAPELRPLSFGICF